MATARLTLLIAILFPGLTIAQEGTPRRLSVFVDCGSTWCDMRFIRSEITMVDFLFDNVAADVHILVTSQGTGGGGTQYQLIFFGQQKFRGLTDTLRFNTPPVTTDNEQRELMLKYLKAGLVPFLIRSPAADHLQINLQLDKNDSTRSAATPAHDPWKAWVMRIGADVNINGDANYNNRNFNGSMSANKITEALKMGMGVNWGLNKSGYEYSDGGVTEKFSVDNHNWSVNQYLVKSLGPKWSWAYEVKYSQNSFSNIRGRLFLRGGIEYNIYPYKDVNNKLFTLSYGLTARKNSYYDSTIYNRTRESLFGHRATAYLSLNQKWGNAYAGITYHNYFSNWKFFNVGVDMYTSVRITGGLSFYILAFGGLTRDQVFLVKGNATPEEVLARRRQLASGYHYFTSVGLNFRFGSKLNNVVNPRFDRSSGFGDE